MEKRIEALEISVNDIKDVIQTGFKKIERNFEVIVEEFKLVHKRIDLLNTKVDLLKGDTNVGFDDVSVKLEFITDEITKIGKVTNYSDYFNNLNSIN